MSANDFAEELKLKLQKTYETITANMSKYRERMSNAYDKSVRINEYSAGDKVWLQIKSVKKHLSRKLSLRRSGPWTIVEIFPNGRNFRIKNDETGKYLVVHHDRIEPANIVPSDVQGGARVTGYTSSSSESESEPDDEAQTENESEPIIDADRRYPARIRVQRQLPGTIPWSSITI